MAVLTGRTVEAFRLLSLRAMLTLESKGMRHSSGPIRPRIAAEFGLKPRAGYDKYIAELNRRLDEIKKAQAKPSMKLQLAATPCHPPYGIVVGDEQLWDCDCAAGTIEDALQLAAEKYPGEAVILFDDPRHYSQQGA